MRITFFFFCLFALVDSLQAINIDWAGGSDENVWFSSQNWNPDIIPNSSSDVAVFSQDSSTTQNFIVANREGNEHKSITVNSVLIERAAGGSNLTYTIKLSEDAFGDTTQLKLAGTNPSITMQSGASAYAVFGIVGQEILFETSGTIAVGASLNTIDLFVTSALAGDSNVTISRTESGNLWLGGGTNGVPINSSFLGTLNIQDGTTNFFAYNLNSTNEINLSSGANIIIESGYGSTTLQNLTGSGGVQLNTTLKLGGTSTFSGLISGGSASASSNVLEILDSSTITLTAASALQLQVQVDEGGTLILSSTGTFANSRGLIVNGTLEIEGNKSFDALSGSGLVNLQGNTLTITSGQATYTGVLSDGTTPGGSLVNTGSNQSIFSGNNTFTGSVTVSNGEIVFGGTNAYTGATSVASGATLTLLGSGDISNSSGAEVNGSLNLSYGDASLKNLTGSGTVTLNGNTLTLSDGGGTFSGVVANGDIRHQSNLVKSGASTSTLTGNNTFLGTLNVSGGQLALSGTQTYTGSTTVASGATLTLSGSASISTSSQTIVNGTLTFDSISGSRTLNSLSGSGSVAIGSTNLTVNQSVDGTLSGGLTGSGTFEKTGASTLTLSGTNGLTGATTVSQGSLILNGTLAGNLTIGSSGTLMGTGTIGSGAAEVENSGAIAPGNSIGTLVISGNYTQNSSGNLQAEITPSQNDLLQVSGTANIAGSITIDPAAGVYTGGTEYTLLTSTGLTGTFTLVTLHEIPGTLSYPSNSVVFTLNHSHHVLPIAKSNIKGNAGNIARYLFRTGDVPSNGDLNSVYGTLLSLSSQNFPTALRKLGPTQFSALPLVSLQNDTRIAGAFTSQWQNLASCFYCQDGKNCSEAYESYYNSFIWVEPLILGYTQDAYKQRGVEEQIKFESLTYGTSSGFTRFLDNHFCLGGILAYTHSNLHWEKNAGNGKWSSLYFGPALGWFSEQNKYYADVILIGVVNFYDIDRRIVFPGLERVAENHHNSYDILLRLDAGTKLKYRGLFFQPEITCNVLTTLEEKYTEGGANSLNLLVDRNQQVYIRPQCTLKFGKEFSAHKMCFLPSFKLGWVSNIPCTNGIYTSRLIAETFTVGNQFPVQGYKRTTNQLVVGGEFEFQLDRFSLAAAFEANYLGQSMIQEGKLRMDWWF